MSYAIDTNILLYASDFSSRFHERARSFLETCMKEKEILCLGWPTVMGYLRIATHPSIFTSPLKPEEAMQNIDALLDLPHARFLSEDEGFWHEYREVTAQRTIRGNLVPDAHLAAILRQYGIKRLYSHDADFKKFSFLNVQDPLI